MTLKKNNKIIIISIIIAIITPTLSTIIILDLQNSDVGPTYYPSLQWMNPVNQSSIIFGTDEANFEFQYSCNSELIDQVKLYMNGFFISDVTDKNSIPLNYNEHLDGEVNATLKGYVKGEEIETNSIKLHFSKLVEDKIEKYDSGTEDLGRKLLLIIHDPYGNESYSEFVSKFEGIRFFMGIDSDAMVNTVFNFNDYYSPYPLIFEDGSLYEYDCLYTLPEIKTLTLSSMQETSIPDIIGPGKGDRYWGQSWELNWSFMGRKQVYFNGTTCYINPYLLYEINSTCEIWENNIYAPQEWKDLNPVLNEYPEDEVDWTGIDALVNATNTISSNVNITVSYSTSTLFGLSDTNLGFSLYTKNYNVHTSYSGDYSDIIKNNVGIDKNFGTFIFQYDGS